MNFWQNYSAKKFAKLGWSFNFNSPKDMVLEHLAVQNTFPWNVLVFGLGYTFLGKYLCPGCGALWTSPKCYDWSPKWEFSWNIHNPTFYSFICTFEEKKSMLITNLSYMLTHRLHINNQNYLSGRHPALGMRCLAK